MTLVTLNAQVDLSDIETSDMLDELDNRDDWDEVCARAPAESLSIALRDRGDDEFFDYRDELYSIYELLHQGREQDAMQRLRELACRATGRVL